MIFKKVILLKNSKKYIRDIILEKTLNIVINLLLQSFQKIDIFSI